VSSDTCLISADICTRKASRRSILNAGQTVPMAENSPIRDDEVIHRLKNDMAIIVGFCDLLLTVCSADNPRRADLLEIHRAAQDALALMPEVTRRACVARERG
jgi:hypothetical protein